MDVWVEEFAYGPSVFYTVWVDGEIYDRMSLWVGPRLTWAQQNDMASYYAEALVLSSDN